MTRLRSARWIPDHGWQQMVRWDADCTYYWGTQRDQFVWNFLDKQ